MSNEARRTGSALQAWAAMVMSGDVPTASDDGELGRAPGQASYDPADVISVFMSARESAKQRHHPMPRADDVQPA